MKTNEQAKTFLMGFIAALLLVMILSASNPAQEEYTGEKGTYQVKVTEDKVLVLNTKTGEFIIHKDAILLGKTVFRKYDFSELIKE